MHRNLGPETSKTNTRRRRNAYHEKTVVQIGNIGLLASASGAGATAATTAAAQSIWLAGLEPGNEHRRRASRSASQRAAGIHDFESDRAEPFRHDSDGPIRSAAWADSESAD